MIGKIRLVFPSWLSLKFEWHPVFAYYGFEEDGDGSGHVQPQWLQHLHGLVDVYKRQDILRTIELGYSNARLEASDNRIKVTIRMAYGFHHVDHLTALITLRCGGLDIRLPQPTI